MDGRASGDGSIGAGELLRSALEKIVYFECRVAQLEAELGAARLVAERARGDAAEARAAETEAVRALASEREARAEASSRALEATDRVRLLEAERERLLSGLVERARVGGAAGADGRPGPEEGGTDLASFIAELRAEIERLQGALAAAGTPQSGAAHQAPSPARPAARAATVEGLASAFDAGGRTSFSSGDAARLKGALASQADKVLYERAMADLSGGQADDRQRAIRQLVALGAAASAPLLASALGREQEAAVKVALLQAMAGLGEPFAAELVVAELSDGRPEVRAAALVALAAIAERQALPHLTRALGDRSPLVRRRAAVLLNTSRDPGAEEALVAALRDTDAGVARAAAVALSGRDGEPVRRALSRYQTVHPAQPPVARPTAARPAPAAAPRARAAVAVLEPSRAAEPATGRSGTALEADIEQELRGALRGLTTSELVAAVGAPAPRLEGALEAMRARGTLALRGARWCVA